MDEETNPKPVGFWVDEYQSLCYPSLDAQFQATARSSWVATVYITQNLNGMFQVMGTNEAQSRTKALLGNMNLKYFASNSDFETNQWASNMIGSQWVNIDTLSYSKDMELSKTQRPEKRPKIEVDEFTTLKTGRKRNNFIVEAIVFKAGKTWGEKNKNFALVQFKQK
jgi:type IV secretory pathway TraG/TraD family ATPase VirD4